MIKITLLNNDIREVKQKTTILELAKNISSSFSKDIIYAKVNGENRTIFDNLVSNCNLNFITDVEDEYSKKILNNTAAQLFSIFLERQKIALKVVSHSFNDEGFYVDVEVKENISTSIIEKLENKFLKFFKTTPVNLPSLEDTTNIKKLFKIKILSISGIQSKKTINRIHAIASFNEKDLENKIEKIEERDSRDHRKIAKQLELFFISDDVGKGLPIWLPNGVELKKQITNYILEQEKKYGSMIVETPELGLLSLYKTSGHYEHYKKTMFPLMKIEGEEFMLRPMACPHHCIIYKQKPRTYKELPFRLAELVNQFRFEPSGALIGLERVRAMELSDSHIFLKMDQLKEELNKGLDLIIETLRSFQIDIDFIELALHDPTNTEKYHGQNSIWNKAEKILRDFLKKKNINFVEKIGEAAFYGPKIDIQIKTALGHILTVSTIQLDFFLPTKFNLLYFDEKQQKQTPIMIHRGLIGTFERLISIILEQTKGVLPVWLAPTQAVIIPINNKDHLEYALDLKNKLSSNRVNIDDSNERISYKIRKQQVNKIPITIIIGDKEISNNVYSIRRYGDEDTKTVSLNKLKEVLNEKK